MYTTNEEGILNNYATEPQMYYAQYPSPEQQRRYIFQGAIATLFVTSLVLIRPLAKINRTGKMPVPQKGFFLVGQASCLSINRSIRTFAFLSIAGLLSISSQCIWINTQLSEFCR